MPFLNAVPSGSAFPGEGCGWEAETQLENCRLLSCSSGGRKWEMPSVMRGLDAIQDDYHKDTYFLSQSIFMHNVCVDFMDWVDIAQ